MRTQLLHSGIPAGIEVHRLDLNLNADPYDWWPALTPNERQHALRFARRADVVRFAATRFAVRHLLAKRLLCCPEQVPFAHGVHGKPYIDTDVVEAPVFNVTHSGACALIAIADAGATTDVGVDIEQCSIGFDTNSVVGIAFTAIEREGIRRAPDPRYAFYTRWVAKEAALKAIGVGMTEHLQSITIRPGSGSALHVHSNIPEWASLGAITLAAPSGYVAALAWRNKV